VVAPTTESAATAEPEETTRNEETKMKREFSNFHTRLNEIPEGCPAEFRKRIIEIRASGVRAKEIVIETPAQQAARQAKEIAKERGL
jgi:hypothetical protein